MRQPKFKLRDLCRVNRAGTVIDSWARFTPDGRLVDAPELGEVRSDGRRHGQQGHVIEVADNGAVNGFSYGLVFEGGALEWWFWESELELLEAGK